MTIGNSLRMQSWLCASKIFEKSKPPNMSNEPHNRVLSAEVFTFILNQLLIRVHAFGLNRGDTVQRAGLYPIPAGAPRTLGLEYSGVIAQTGDKVAQRWNVGDEVFGLVVGGAYAEYVVVEAGLCVRKPREWGWELAGGMAEALYMVGDFDPAMTRSVLWNAGASTISICGIQLCVAEDVKVFATTRQESKKDFCEGLGCTGVVNTSTSSDSCAWVEKIKSLNDGKGIDLIIDFIGGSSFSSLLELAAQDGKIINLGLLGGAMTEKGRAVNVSPFVMKRLRYEGSTLRSRDITYQGRVRELFEGKALPGLLNGTLTHHVERVFDWEDVVKAHELMESNATMGKIVCVIKQ